MDSQQAAHDLLNQARKLLTQRLERLVLASSDGLLEDARGSSYMNEIGTLYDAVGARLTQVNSLLGHLQAQAPGEGKPATSQGDVPTFKEFAMRVGEGDLPEASRLLSPLLAIDLSTAERCSRIYGERMRDYPETVARTMQLREKLAEGNRDGAMLILLECFALSGTDAFRAIDHLTRRFAA